MYPLLSSRRTMRLPMFPKPMKPRVGCFGSKESVFINASSFGSTTLSERAASASDGKGQFACKSISRLLLLHLADQRPWAAGKRHSHCVSSFREGRCLRSPESWPGPSFPSFRKFTKTRSPTSQKPLDFVRDAAFNPPRRAGRRIAPRVVMSRILLTGDRSRQRRANSAAADSPNRQ